MNNKSKNHTVKKSKDSESIHPAATVILLRDTGIGFKILFLRRNAKLIFHGGSWVFPGGRIDPDDFINSSDDDMIGAARQAAVREAKEEAGINLFPEDLVFISHWITPLGKPKRFSTWFFAARAGNESVKIDGGEIHEHSWLSPDEVLDAQRAGKIKLPGPTFVLSLLLSAYKSTDDAISDLSNKPPLLYKPRIVPVPGGECSLYEEDAAYSSSDLNQPGQRHRLWMVDSGWRYEQSGQ